MNDNDLGKNYYTYTVRGWPNPTGWENLSAAAKSLWIMRAKKQMEREKNEPGILATS